MIYLLIGYMFLFVHRPFEVWPLLGTIQLERVYVLITLISWLFYPRKIWIRTLHTPAFIFFILAMVLSYLVSPYPDTGWFVLDKYLKQSVFYFLVLSTVSDAQMLRKLLIGFLVVMGIYLTHSYREYRNGRHQYRMGIVRMIGVDETSGEPNAFGATIVYSLPLTVPFWREASRLATRKKRLAERLAAGLSDLAVAAVRPGNRITTGFRGSCRTRCLRSITFEAPPQEHRPVDGTRSGCLVHHAREHAESVSDLD